jgi:hypothetical protein
VIVLNKPPGLVSQATSRSARSTVAPTTGNPATRTRQPPLNPQAPAPPGPAFNDVLNGKELIYLFILLRFDFNHFRDMLLSS